MNNSADYFIFDLETLSTEPEAVVLSISMLAGRWDEIGESTDVKETFEQLVSKGVTFRVSVETQKECNRKIDTGTLRWWKNHKDALSHVLKEGDMIEPYDLYGKMQKFLVDNSYSSKETIVWIRAPHFDHVILQHFFRQFMESDASHFPYNQFKIRDVRTAIDCWTKQNTGYLPNMEELTKEVNATKHIPVHDCALDVLQLAITFSSQD